MNWIIGYFIIGAFFALHRLIQILALSDWERAVIGGWIGGALLVLFSLVLWPLPLINEYASKK